MVKVSKNAPPPAGRGGQGGFPPGVLFQRCVPVYPLALNSVPMTLTHAAAVTNPCELVLYSPQGILVQASRHTQRPFRPSGEVRHPSIPSDRRNDVDEMR